METTKPEANLSDLNDHRIKTTAQDLLEREAKRFGVNTPSNPVDAAVQEHEQDMAAQQPEEPGQEAPQKWGAQKKGGWVREIAGQSTGGALSDLANTAWDFASLMWAHGQHAAQFAANPAVDPAASFAMNLTEGGQQAYMDEVAKARESAAKFEKGYSETFGSEDNNIAAWPEPEHWYGHLARALPQFLTYDKMGRSLIGKASTLAPSAIDLIAGDQAVLKYGPPIQKVLNNRWFQKYTAAGFADAVMTEDNGGTMFNLINDAAEKSGYGNFVPDFLAAQEGDSMAVLRLKNMASGATFMATLDTLLMGTAFGRAAIKAGWNSPQMVEALLAGKRMMSKLAPKSARRTLIEDLARDQNNFPIVQDVNGIDRVLTETPGGVDYAEASARVPAEPAPPRQSMSTGPMGPTKPDVLEATTRQGEAVDPNAPGNVAAKEFGANVVEDAQTQGYLRSEQNPVLRDAVRRAYREGAFKETSALARRYSKDFWSGVRDGFEKAGKPLSRAQLRFLRVVMDNQAVNFSVETGMPQEAYYWYRFGNNTYDAIRVLQDAPGFSTRVKMPAGADAQSMIPSKMVFGYDGAPNASTMAPGVAGAAESKTARFYEFDGKGNASRVHYSHGASSVDGPGLVDAFSPYHVYAKQHGDDAARKLLIALSDAADAQEAGAGSISKTMDKFSLDREGAIKAILTGVAEGKTPGHALQFISDDYDAAVSGILKKVTDTGAGVSESKQMFTDLLHKPLLDIGVDGMSRPMGPGSFIREWFDNSGRDVKVVKAGREEGMTHSSFPITADEAKATLSAAEQEAADALMKASEASSRLGQAKVIDEEINKFLANPSAPDVAQKIDELLAAKYGPSEYIPVTRAHGGSNAGSPDGEFVAVTTNPSSVGEKLWVRRSDLVAPTEDGFFARTANVIPEEEFGNATHFEQSGKSLLPKGAIDFEKDGKAIISLYSGRADFSTFIHETGHLFFRDLEFMPQLNVPRNSISQWLGVNPRIPYERWPVEAQEKWAKGFENYIATGEAPVGMGTLMRSARMWMGQVYGGMLRQELGPELPPEIAAFMGKVISGSVAGPAATTPFAGFKEGKSYLNYDTIDSEEQLKGMVKFFRDKDIGIVDHQSGAVMKFDDVKAEAARTGRTVNELLGMPPGMDPHDAYALRTLNISSAAAIDRLAERAIASGSVEDSARVMKAIALHRVINVRESIESRAAARGLGSRRMVVSVNEDMVKQVLKSVDEMTGDELKHVTTYIKGFDGDTERLSKFLDGYIGPSFADVMHEQFLGSILSSPATQLKNIAGNAASISHMLAMTYATSKVNKALGITGNQAIGQGSVDAMWYGFMRGMAEGGPIARTMYRDDWIDPAYSGKYGGKGMRAFTSEGFRPRWGDKVFYEGDMGIVGDAIDWIGANVVRQPGRLIRSADGFSKSVIFRMAMHSRAYSAAQDEAQRILVESGRQATPQEMQLFMNNWLAKPPLDELRAARKDAIDGTFQSEFKSKTGKAFANLGNTPIGRKIMPFMKITMNLYRAGAKNLTPGGVFFKDFRDRLLSKDPRIAQVARTQYAASWWFFMAIGDAVDRGILTTDYPMGPENINKRQSFMRTGIPELGFSVNGPNGAVFSAKGIDPVSGAISLMARTWQIIDKMDEQTAAQMALSVMTAAMKTFAEKSTMDGLQKIIQIFQSPDGMTESAMTYLGEMLASHIVPARGLLSSVERVTDPTTRSAVISPEDDITKSDPSWAAVQRLLNEAQKNIPGLGERMPANIDIYGDEMRGPLNGNETWYGRVYNNVSPVPFGYAKKENAQFEAMFARNNFYPEKPPRYLTVNGEQVYMTTDEYDMYSRKSGKYLREYLNKSKPMLDKMEDGKDKVAFIQDIISAARKKARIDMYGKDKEAQMNIKERYTTSAAERQKKVGTESWGLSSSVSQSIKRP